MDSIEEMLSEKSKLIIIVNKYKLSFHKYLKSKFKLFKCTEQDCKANLKISNIEEIV